MIRTLPRSHDKTMIKWAEAMERKEKKRKDQLGA